MSQMSKRGLFASGLAALMPAIVLGATGTPLVGSKVDNFMLADQTGMGHELYYYTASPADRHRLLRRRRRRVGQGRRRPRQSPRQTSRARTSCS